MPNFRRLSPLRPAPSGQVDLPPKAAKSALPLYLELAQTVVCALVIAGLTHAFLFQPFTIPSSSMEPGLVTGDYILVSKFAYGWSRASFPFNPPLPSGRFGGGLPKRGDVVVFRRPYDPQAAWIKRVIGLPGDRVEVVRGEVRLNGQGLPQAIIDTAWDHDAPWRNVVEAREMGPDGRSHTLYAGGPGQDIENTNVYIVPPGQYFVMGDNRDNSADSRFPREVGVGFLPAENIIGKAELILFSWTPRASVARSGTILGFQLDHFFRVIV